MLLSFSLSHVKPTLLTYVPLPYTTTLYKQLKKPADVMVSETFDAALIGEKFLSILTHAKTSGVLKKNALIIPNSAVIFGTLLESTLSLVRVTYSGHYLLYIYTSMVICWVQ